MKVELIGKDRRQTGNKSWPWDAKGVIGSKMAATALELKSIIQRDMGSQSIVEANRLCNAIINDAERVEGLENVILIRGA
jgi:hypothetical protein